MRPKVNRAYSGPATVEDWNLETIKQAVGLVEAAVAEALDEILDDDRLHGRVSFEGGGLKLSVSVPIGPCDGADPLLEFDLETAVKDWINLEHDGGDGDSPEYLRGCAGKLRELAELADLAAARLLVAETVSPEKMARLTAEHGALVAAGLIVEQ